MVHSPDRSIRSRGSPRTSKTSGIPSQSNQVTWVLGESPSSGSPNRPPIEPTLRGIVSQPRAQRAMSI